MNTDGNLYSLRKHLDEQDANEKAYEENQKEFNDAVNDELSLEISLMLSAKNDEVRESLYTEIEGDFASIIKRFEAEPISLEDWASEYHEEVKNGRLKKIELNNTQNIGEWADMTPFTTPVSNFIEAFNLPSYSYPEVYEYFVAQMDLQTTEDEDENLIFDWGNNFEKCSLEDIYTLIDNIKDLDDNKMLFFQVKNAVEDVRNRNTEKRESNKEKVAEIATKIQP